MGDKYRLAISGMLLFLLSYSAARAQADDEKSASEDTYSLQSKSGITVTVDAKLGQYAVTYYGEPWLGNGIVSVLANKRWYRSANVKLPQPDGADWSQSKLIVESVKKGSSSDRLGFYAFIDIDWRVPDVGVDLITGFRLYQDNPYLVFVQRFPKGFINYASGNWTVPAVAFPQFISRLRDSDNLTSWTSGGMFNERLGYGPVSTLGGTVEPLLVADKEQRAMILSPASNYLVATQQNTPVATRNEENPAKFVLSCGIEGLVETIPIGFEQKHILVVGVGINHTFRLWGTALLDLSGKKVPSKYEGVNMKYPDYWVDWGSYYREHGFKEEGYKTFEDVILGVAEDAKKHGLRMGAYMVQDLDQTRYKEGLIEPREDLFPHGLAWLHGKLGAPLEAYVAWLAVDGPYRKNYAFFATPKGAVPGESMGDVFYSEDYWRHTADKLKSWGAIVLQQDFENVYEGDPVMMGGIDRMNRYFKNQAKACQEKGITMQYGAQMPRNVMESTENPTMISLQAAWDHHVWMSEPSHRRQDDDPVMWRRIIFNSAFYGALGIWPSRDQTQTIADPNAFENLLLANLLGGEIQLGHRIGECDFDLVRKTYREGDGLVLKPDRPITPIDRSYLENGLLGYTESTISGHSWYYVLNLPAAGFLPSFRPSDLGVGGRWIVYNFDTQVASMRDSTDTINLSREAKHQYFIVAPLFDNGMTALGDVEKFVPMADMRIASVEASADWLRLGVISNSKESPIIVGYSAARPANVTAGDVQLTEVSSLKALENDKCGWFWDHQTKLWHVKVDFSESQKMETKSFAIWRTENAD